MRSSKSRSRSKSNRNRSVGNIVNRVFDSSGPEGKVRGTPQQIIEKYNQLARDAQLSNDRVSMENFQQHSEHYTRMLGEAQREADARREQHEAQNRDRQRDYDDSQGAGQGSGQGAEQVSGLGASQTEGSEDRQDRRERQAQFMSEDPMPVDRGDALGEVVDLESGSDSGLVETPESKPRRPRRPRKPREPQSDKGAEPSGESGAGEAPSDPGPSDSVPGAPSGSDHDSVSGTGEPQRPEAAE